MAFVRRRSQRAGRPDRAQRGAVAIIVAISIVTMIGMVGLAIDLGQIFVAKTELQNGADACALAAVADMHPGTTKPTELALAAGRKVVALHRAGFQNHALSGTATPVTIEFSEAASGPFVSGSGLTTLQANAMKYVRCSVTYSGIKTFFIQVLNVLPGVNIGDQQVTASAVASLLPSQGGCAIPIALCTADAVSPKKGQWFPGPLQPGPNADLIAGNFGWVDLTPGGKGTSDIGSQVSGEGVCVLPEIGTPVAVAGNRTALAAQFNSRFGIYFGAVQAGDAAPDRTGFAYTRLTWPAMKEAFSDYPTRSTANAPYQGDSVTGLSVQGSANAKLKPYLQQYGRDRRVVTVPVVDCTAEGKLAKNATVTGWGCVFLLHPMNETAPAKDSSTGILNCFDGANSSKVCVEYLGKANEVGSPCGSTGMPGAPYSPGPRVPALVK